MSRLLPVATCSLIVASSRCRLPRSSRQRRLQPCSGAESGRAAGERSRRSTTIQGNALDSTNGQMTNAIVRLRDARFGRIVDTQLTDKSGIFAFKAIDPGSYIVEIMANDQSILAASQLLNVNAGEAVSAVVKLPFRIPPFAGAGRRQRRGRLPWIVATQAAASSVAAVVPTRPSAPTSNGRCSSPLLPARRDRRRRSGRGAPEREPADGGIGSGAVPAAGARRTRRRTRSICSIASRCSTATGGCASPSSSW